MARAAGSRGPTPTRTYKKTLWNGQRGKQEAWAGRRRGLRVPAGKRPFCPRQALGGAGPDGGTLGWTACPGPGTAQALPAGETGPVTGWGRAAPLGTHSLWEPLAQAAPEAWKVSRRLPASFPRWPGSLKMPVGSRPTEGMSTSREPESGRLRVSHDPRGFSGRGLCVSRTPG